MFKRDIPKEASVDRCMQRAFLADAENKTKRLAFQDVFMQGSQKEHVVHKFGGDFPKRANRTRQG